jgi:cell division protein FtsW (lipid II flippase)
VNDFWQDFGGTGPEIRLGGNADALVRQQAFLFCMGVAAFTVHSFSYSENFIRQAGLVILPVFLMLAVIAAALPQGAPLARLSAELSWHGAGAGAIKVIEAMNSQTPAQAHSFFVRRVIEQGVVGTSLLYLLYLLPGVALVRYMVRSGRKAVGLSALAVMAVMAGLDIMVPAGGMVVGILFMGTAYVALAWGHSAYLRPYWALKLGDPQQA